MTDDPNIRVPLVYPGDEAYAEFLERYACPLSFETVKFRFWGQMVTIASGVHPAQEIQDIWKGGFPEFRDDEEAQTFLDVVISLWNALSVLNMSGRFLPLSQHRDLESAEGLAEMVECRLDELKEGFLTGFLIDVTENDQVSQRTEDCLLDLVEIVEDLESLAREIERDKAGYPEVRRRFLAVDRAAQRILNNLVKAANADRKVSGRTSTDH